MNEKFMMGLKLKSVNFLIDEESETHRLNIKIQHEKIEREKQELLKALNLEKVN